MLPPSPPSKKTKRIAKKKTSRPTSGRFQLEASRLFLTYAQCPLPPRTLYDVLHEQVFSSASLDVLDHLIVQEKHKDGHYHLHAYYRLSKPLAIRSQSALSSFYLAKLGNDGGPVEEGELKDRYYLPHLESVRSPSSIVKYLLKDQVGDVFSNKTKEQWIEMIKTTQAKKRYIPSEIVNSADPTAVLIDLILRGQLHVKDYQQIKASVLQFMEDVILKVTPKRTLMLFSALPNPWNLYISIEPPEIKKRHIWITGSKNTGKTAYANILTRHFPILNYSLQTKWQKLDRQPCLIVLDEFCGTLPYTLLNQLCDPSPTLVDRKYSTPFGITSKPIVVVLSNFTIEQLYQHSSSLGVQSKQLPGILENFARTTRMETLNARFSSFEIEPVEESILSQALELTDTHLRQVLMKNCAGNLTYRECASKRLHQLGLPEIK